jgi:hypothetical protein
MVEFRALAAKTYIEQNVNSLPAEGRCSADS